MKNKVSSKLLIAGIMMMLVFSMISYNISLVADDSNEKLIFDLSFEKPIVEKITVGSTVFDRVTVKGLELTDNSGKPRVPVKPLYVLIPANCEIVSIKIDGSNQILSGRYQIEPGREPIPISSLNDNIYNNDETALDKKSTVNQQIVSTDKSRLNGVMYDSTIYGSSKSYPESPFEKIGVQSYRGYNILVINIYPVQYIPSEETISYYTSLKISIETNYVKNTEYHKLFRKIESDKDYVQSIVENPEILSSYATLSTLRSESSPLVDSADSYEYVIITNETLESASGAYTFQDLRDHKINNGMNATIVTVEDIYSNYTGFDHQEKIRNFITDAYMNWETEYVLLGGDTKDVAGPVGDAVFVDFPTVTIADYDTYNEGLTLGYVDQDLDLGNLYYDAMSYFSTSYSSNIAMTTSERHIYVTAQTPDTNNGTAVYLKYDNPDTQPDIEYMDYLYRDDYNYSDPDVGANGSDVAWVYAVENPNSYDIFCWYSHDDFDTYPSWSYPCWSSSYDELYPSVYVNESMFYVAYVDVTNNDIYYTTSTNGSTWATPVKVNTGKTIVAEEGCVDINPAGITWVDNRSGNKDIYCYSFTTGAEHQVTSASTDEYRPQLAMDESGNILLGYTKEVSVGSDTDVCLTYSTDDGVSWTPFTTPWGAETGIQIGPDLIYDNQTHAFYGSYVDSENVFTKIFKISDILNPSSCETNGWIMSGQTSANESALTYWWADYYSYSTTHEGIPSRSLYVDGEFMPSDLYYACLDGSFNSDGDTKYGEPTDGLEGADVDLYADVYVGRMPVDDEIDLSNFINKTLTYDNYPLNEMYLEDVLLAGEYLEFHGPSDWGGNHMDELVDTCINHGYTTNGITSDDHSIYELYDRHGIMKELVYDISELIGHSTALISFELWGDGVYGSYDGIQKAGVYIDDVEIRADGSPIFSDDMEAGSSSWSHYGSADEWEVGTPTNVPETYGGLPSSGSNCWATDLDDTYNGTGFHYLTTNPFSVSPSVSTLTLHFKTWFCTEYRTGNPDYFVIYSKNGSSALNMVDYWYGCNGWNKQELIDNINNDVHMIHHLGHSGDAYTLKMGIGDVQSLTNDKPFFAYSQGCWPGAFDNVNGYDCIAETFVNAEQGAFAVIMNARSGYGAWNSTDGKSQRYHREFVDAIYGEDMPELGRANHDSKHDNIYRIDESVMRWVCYETNLFGDPSLSIKTPGIAEADRDYGDAPEGDDPMAIAYPSTMTPGSFPTCKCCGPSGYIEHANFGASFGPSFDYEFEGNAGLCPNCFPSYDNDECYQDGDAGLLIPDAFTINASLIVVPCNTTMTMPLGQIGQQAVWGTNIDIEVHNHMPSETMGYVNVLMDWNQDGDWNDAGEHVLVDHNIPNPFDGSLSALSPPPFIIGPNPGFVWARFSITERPVGSNWNGTGVFEDGETEDYLLNITSPQRIKITDFSVGWNNIALPFNDTIVLKDLIIKNSTIV